MSAGVPSRRLPGSGVRIAAARIGGGGARIANRLLDDPILFWFSFAAGILAAGAVLIFLCRAPVPPVAHGLGVLLLAICLIPVALYVRRRDQQVPFFPIICIAYASVFVLPLWRGAHTESEYGYLLLSPRVASTVLIYIGVGVSAMIAGYFATGFARPVFGRPFLDWNLDPKWATRLAVVTVIGDVFLNQMTLLDKGGFLGPFKQPVAIVCNAHFGIAILAALYFRSGRARLGYLLYGAVILRGIVALYMTALSEMIMPVAVVLCLQWRYKKKLPLRLLLIAGALYLLIQPAKITTRARVLNAGEGAGSAVGRLIVFAEEFTKFWFGGQEDSGKRAESESWERLTGLNNFAVVSEMTPAVIPYWGGSTYRYLAVSLIPRFVWPEKPAAQDAQNWYALAYGFLKPEQIGQTWFGMHQIIEVYLNFGLLGLFFVMPIVGAFYRSIAILFSESGTGDAGQVVVVTLLTGFVNIETATAGLLGGVIQNLLVYSILLNLVRRRESTAPVGLGDAVAA